MQDFNARDIIRITSLPDYSDIPNIDDFPIVLPVSIIGRIQTYILNDRMYRIFDPPNGVGSYYFYVSPRARINTST